MVLSNQKKMFPVCCTVPSSAVVQNGRNLLLVENNLNLDITEHQTLHGFIQNKYSGLATPNTDVCLIDMRDVMGSLNKYLSKSKYDNIGILFHGDFDPSENTCVLFGLKFSTDEKLMKRDPSLRQAREILNFLATRTAGFLHIFSCSVGKSNGFKSILLDVYPEPPSGISVTNVDIGEVNGEPYYEMSWNTKEGFLAFDATNTPLSAISVYLIDVNFVQQTLSWFSSLVSWSFSDLVSYLQSDIGSWFSSNITGTGSSTKTKSASTQTSLFTSISKSALFTNSFLAYIMNYIDGLVFPDYQGTFTSGYLSVPPVPLLTNPNVNIDYSNLNNAQAYQNRFEYFRFLGPALTAYIYAMDALPTTSTTLTQKLASLNSNALLNTGIKAITGDNYPLNSKTNGVGWVAFQTGNTQCTEIVIGFRGTYSISDVIVDLYDVASQQTTSAINTLATTTTTPSGLKTYATSTTTSKATTGASLFPWMVSGGVTSPMYFHTGSTSMFNGMSSLLTYLNTLSTTKTSKTRVVFSAHSLGSAFAAYAASYFIEKCILNNTVPNFQVELYMYEPFRFATSNFNTYLTNLLLLANNGAYCPLYSILSTNDIIPILSLYNTNLQSAAPPQAVNTSDLGNTFSNILSNTQSLFQYQYVGCDTTVPGFASVNSSFSAFFKRITINNSGGIAVPYAAMVAFPASEISYTTNLVSLASSLKSSTSLSALPGLVSPSTSWSPSPFLPKGMNITRIIFYLIFYEIDNIPNTTFLNWVIDFIVNTVLASSTAFSLITAFIPSSIVTAGVDAVFNYIIDNSSIGTFINSLPSLAHLVIQPIVTAIIDDITKDTTFAQFSNYAPIMGGAHSLLSYTSAYMQYQNNNGNAATTSLFFNYPTALEPNLNTASPPSSTINIPNPYI